MPTVDGLLRCTLDVRSGSKADKPSRVKIQLCPLLIQSGHIGDLSRYLLMILSGHDAIAGLDLKYAQIR